MLNLPVHEMKFYTNNLLLTLLLPEIAREFSVLMLTKYELKMLPVMHSLGYRHLIYLDTLNLFGCGPNAMISISGSDKSKCHILSGDFTSYLFDLSRKLDNGYFFYNDGSLLSFPSDVREEGGSITVTEGLKFEAVA
jgi:hypothetical protein